MVVIFPPQGFLYANIKVVHQGVWLLEEILVSQHEKFGSVLSSLHDAALDDALWPAASGRIDEFCGLRGSTLVVATGHSQADADIFFARICRHGERLQEWERSYFDQYFPLDERVPRMACLPDSRLVPVASLYTERERKTSVTYNEALPVGRYRNGLNIRLDGPEGASIYWALADSIQREGWVSGQLAMIKSLLPHLRHLLRTRHALIGARSLSASLCTLLDSSRIGVIQLDRDGTVIEANDRARGLLQVGQGLFDRNGYLHARLVADDALLQRLLANALPRFGVLATGGSMTVTRRPCRPRQVVIVHPVGDRQSDFGIGRVAVLVLVVEPGNSARLDAKLVASALGLTQTESQVAVALANGRTANDIAKDRSISISTARFHVKQIHAKLGISRQTDLIRLVLSMADLSVCRHDYLDQTTTH